MITNIIQHVYLISTLTGATGTSTIIEPPRTIKVQVGSEWVEAGVDAYANWPSNRIDIAALKDELGTNAVWGAREIIEVLPGPEEIEHQQRLDTYNAAVSAGFTWTNGWTLGLTENDQTRFTSALAAANLMAEIYPPEAVPVDIAEKDGTPHTIMLPEFKSLLRAYAVHYITLRNQLKGE